MARFKLSFLYFGKKALLTWEKTEFIEGNNVGELALLFIDLQSDWSVSQGIFLGRQTMLEPHIIIIPDNFTQNVKVNHYKLLIFVFKFL